MTDRPPEDGSLIITPGGCSGRLIAYASLAVVVVAAGLILIPKLFDTTDAFDDAGNSASGRTQVGVPFAFGLGGPNEAVDLLGASAQVDPASASAVVDVLVCGSGGIDSVKHVGSPT